MLTKAAEAAELFLHTEIPLTRAMGVRVVVATATEVVIEAPVALNHNHLRTAFGGSINALATVCGYAVLWLDLRAEAAHVVVAESSIRYLRPIRETIRATCAVPSAEKFFELRFSLAAEGKARVRLNVAVKEGNVLAAEFSGTFVATR